MEGVKVPDTSNVGNKTLFEGVGYSPVNYMSNTMFYPGTVVQDTATGMKAEMEAQQAAEGMADVMKQAKQEGTYVNYVKPVPTSVPEPVSRDMELNQLPSNPGFAPTEGVVASVGNEKEPMSGGAGSKRRRSNRRRSKRRRSKRRLSEKRQPKRRRSKKRRSERRQSKRRRSKKPIRKHRTQRKKNNV